MLSSNNHLEANSFVIRVLTTLAVFYVMLFVDTLARTIGWGNAAFEDKFYLSDGTDLQTTDATVTYNFELGTFDSPPTGANVSNWAAEWNTFDRTNLNKPAAFFSSSATREADGSSSSADSSGVFAVGEQAYIWAFDGDTIEESTEWALFTNSDTGAGDDGVSWLMPEHSTDPEILQWRLAEADTVIFGGIDNTTSALGSRTGEPVDFDLQTHSITVPEPSTAMLVVIAALGGVMRRRR